jgi:hypothetical protein
VLIVSHGVAAFGAGNIPSCVKFLHPFRLY